MAKEKRVVLVTPRGRAIFPRLNTPDTKFKEAGEYSVKLAVDAKLAEEFISKIDAAHAKAQVEAKEDPKNAKKKIKEGNLPYETNPDNDEEVIFKFKSVASFKSKKTGETVKMKPGIFDAKGKPCDVSIGGGSILRVSFEPASYYTPVAGAGVTLRLNGVQVIELKEFGGRSSSDLGFEEEEGYEVEESDEEAPQQEKEADVEEDSSSDKKASDGSDF